MRQLSFTCTIVSSMTSFISLNGSSVPLSLSGNTWSGTKDVAIDDSDVLNIAVTCTGITDSPWSVKITTDCDPPAQAAEVYSNSGSIPHGGSEGFQTSVKIADDPCKKGGDTE